MAVFLWFYGIAVLLGFFVDPGLGVAAILGAWVPAGIAGLLYELGRRNRKPPGES